MLKLIPIIDMNYESVLDLAKEYREYGDEPFYLWYTRFSPKEYYDYIKKYEKNTYYLIDDVNPNYILGEISMKMLGLDFHNKSLSVGNIGYSIRPGERCKGYGNEILKLILPLCEELGMNEVCVSCYKDNIASKKIIENNRGKLETEFVDYDNGKDGLKYFIELHPKFKQYIKWKKYMMKFK